MTTASDSAKWNSPSSQRWSRRSTLQGQNRPQVAHTDSGKGEGVGEGGASLEEEGPLPITSGRHHQDGGCSRPTSSGYTPQWGSPWPQHPAGCSRQLPHYASFSGFMGCLSFSPGPGGLLAFPSCTLSQSREHCYPPAACFSWSMTYWGPGLLCLHPRLKNIWLQIQR